MITIRPAHQRGHANHGWLNTHHTFSFARYHDPQHMGFRSLRVINDDIVQEGMGFGMHPHQDMEIITYILEGSLEHRDSMGNGSVITRGDLQRMSAGTGVMHSEFNASQTQPVHLLQIWIIPEQMGLDPSYEERKADNARGLRVVASRNPENGAVKVHQDVTLYIATLGEGQQAQVDIQPGRSAWVHVATGQITLNGQNLSAGDGAAITDEDRIALTGVTESETLIFDLA